MTAPDLLPVPASRRTGVVVFCYSLLVYLLFHGVYAAFVAFLVGIPLPRAIDAGPAGDPFAAVAINLALVAAFGLQHSVMAREGFKRAVTRLVPPAAERATYCLASCVALGALIAAWRPLPFVVWDAGDGPARTIVHGVFAAGNLLLLASTFHLDHAELFGLRQGWAALRGRPLPATPFRTPGLYRYVRHPIYLGWITMLFAHPTMTAGRLSLAGACTIYILVAIVFEERDLVRRFGAAYERYRDATPRLWPAPNARGRSRAARATATTTATTATRCAAAEGVSAAP